jgi:hypothetical protein
MAARQRKPTDKKMPAFRAERIEDNTEENDLKKVKENILRQLNEDTTANDKEWYDKELEKNLKNLK